MALVYGFDLISPRCEYRSANSVLQYRVAVIWLHDLIREAEAPEPAAHATC
jgi:hypothetical protein